MRNPATYRVARRDAARQAMLRLREQGKPRNWRLAWASIQAAVEFSRRRPAPHADGAK